MAARLNHEVTAEVAADFGKGPSSRKYAKGFVDEAIGPIAALG